MLIVPVDGSLTGDAPFLIYTPNADWYGNDSFTFSVSDGGLADTATVSITVNAINDAPVLTDIGAQETDENIPKIISLSATDTENDSLFFGAESDNADVIAEIITGNTLVLTP